MAITINGTGSITGLTAGGLPDGSVVAADLASSLDLTGKTVTLPSGTGGKILQVVQGFKSNNYSSTATTTWLDVPDLSVTITPVAADSNFLLTANIHSGMSTTGDIQGFRFVRGSTAIGVGTTGTGNQTNASFSTDSVADASRTVNGFGCFLDEDPAYTLGNSLTYKLQMFVWSGTGTINQPNDTANNHYIYRTTSSITVMEVAA